MSNLPQAELARYPVSLQLAARAAFAVGPRPPQPAWPAPPCTTNMRGPNGSRSPPLSCGFLLPNLLPV